ncbi:maleylpyruvate isomerase N-terminal domain-containing protein [Nocardioides luteus]|uniref:maleylpyruvate isomerase N-terminal domain-containing protein n=1 Tax=Nocardioides luteus TaxID=1844 RepID=UPI00166412A5
MTKLSAIQLDERDALAQDLRPLAPEQWRTTTLCGEWDVEEVVSHLGAASRLSFPGWLRSMSGARFDQPPPARGVPRLHPGGDPVELRRHRSDRAAPQGERRWARRDDRPRRGHPQTARHPARP